MTTFGYVYLSTGSRNARNAKAPGVENDRILQILLNLIETLADDSLNPTRTQLNTVSGTAGSLGIAAITRFLVKSTTTTANGNASNVTTGGLSQEPAWLPSLKMPSRGITRQNSGSGVGTGQSGETDTESTSKGGMFLLGYYYCSFLVCECLITFRVTYTLTIHYSLKF